MKDQDAEVQEKLQNYNNEDVSTIASGAAVVFFGKVFRSLIQYVFLIVISRILGVESFGLYMLGFTIISFSAILARLGLDNAAIRFVSMHNGTGEGLLVKMVILRTMQYAFLCSLLVTFCLYLNADLLANQLFSKPELESVIHLLSIAIPFLTLMTIALAVTQGFKRMKYSAYCQDIFYPLVNLSLAIVFFLIGYELFGVMLAWILSTILSFLLSLYFLKKVTSEIIIEKATQSVVPKLTGLISYASPLLLIVLLTTLLTWVDTLMLGYFRTSTEVGIYGAAAKTAMLTGIILVSVNTIFSPMIADFYNRKETQRLELMFKFSASWIYILSLPFFLIFVLFAKKIMAVFGVEFISGWSVLIIISFGYFINASTGSVGNMLIMSGHQKLMMYNSMFVFIFNILSNYFLIPIYGMTGAALTSSLSIIAYNLLMLIEVYWWLKMHPYNIRFIKSSMSGLAVFLVFFLLIGSVSWSVTMELIIFIPLFLVVYFWFIYKFCMGDEEIVILNKIKTKIASSSRN